MRDEYLIFAINEIKKALKNKKEKLYIGYDDFSEKTIGFNISIESWNEFLTILKEYAIEEECYEYCEEISNLQSEVKKYVDNYLIKNESLTSFPKS